MKRVRITMVWEARADDGVRVGEVREDAERLAVALSRFELHDTVADATPDGGTATDVVAVDTTVEEV